MTAEIPNFARLFLTHDTRQVAGTKAPVKAAHFGARLPKNGVIRSMPKVIIALVAGYAIGGGHVLHILCDLTIAADNAIFGQTGPKVGQL